MKIKFILFVCLLLITNLYPQSVNGRFVEVLNNGSEFEVKVQLNANSSSVKLGTSTLIFDYNSSGLSFPYSPEYNIDYQFHNYTSTTNILYDSATVTAGGADRLYINLDLLLPNDGQLIAEAPNWSDIVTIKFTIIDPNQHAGINWVNPNNPPTRIEIFADDNFTILTQTSFEGLNTILPVELISFNASIDETNINLYWETATEIDNFGFEIEHNTPLSSPFEGGKPQASVVWETIGFVPGAGNSNSPKKYSYIDNSPIGSSRFVYRLKQIDNDGDFEYSNSVEVDLSPNEYSLYQNYPNPFNPTTTIRFSLKESQNVTIIIYDQLGQQVETALSQKYETGYHEFEFNASNIASGIYFYRIIAGDFVNVKKMMLVK